MNIAAQAGNYADKGLHWTGGRRHAGDWNKIKCKEHHSFPRKTKENAMEISELRNTSFTVIYCSALILII